jgi:hypothetical protein
MNASMLPSIGDRNPHLHDNLCTIIYNIMNDISDKPISTANSTSTITTYTTRHNSGSNNSTTLLKRMWVQPHHLCPMLYSSVPGLGKLWISTAPLLLIQEHGSEASAHRGLSSFHWLFIHFHCLWLLSGPRSMGTCSSWSGRTRQWRMGATDGLLPLMPW